MQHALTTLLADDSPPVMPDAQLLRDYLRKGSPQGDPLCLSFGETWSEVATGLAACVDSTERSGHGYQLSMYGLPALRRALIPRLLAEHGLDDPATWEGRLDLAVTWTGTRSAMYDYGRFLRAEDTTDRIPVAVVAGPSWDYSGVLTPLGYRVRYLELSPTDGFRPDPQAFAALVDDIAGNPKERLALVVVNTQHNPTAVNWPASFVTQAVRTAFDRDAAVLVDDAYFAVHNLGVTPTSALKIVLGELANRPAGRHHWLAVRSLGKQFHCNGWGLGTVVGDPSTLETLVNRYRLHHSLMYGGIQQQAMARWLEDPASDAFLAEQQRKYTKKRHLIGEFLRQRLGYPADKVHLGECTSYMLFAVPACHVEAHSTDGGKAPTERFRQDCFDRTGVLFAPAWPWPYSGDARPLPWMRMFLGPDADRLMSGLERLAEAGISYQG
ncbi:aminotransferase class I/II-fold pyridoxal phosphate-dependent enzyme [Micromonospora sp. BQ11]